MLVQKSMPQGGRFIGEPDARTEIFAFIEVYHNTHRIHSSLGYRGVTSVLIAEDECFQLDGLFLE